MGPLVLIKVLLFLVFIIASIYFCFLIVGKRLNNKKSIHQKHINVIAHRRLDQKLTISLVIIDDQHIIVAANPNAIALKMLAEKL